MEEVFSILFAETNDSQSFENSLEKNFQAIYDFFNAPYQIQYKHKEEIEHFILLKNKAISGSSFQTSESRSFLLILLNLCERFALYSSIPPVIRIIKKNDIYTFLCGLSCFYFDENQFHIFIIPELRNYESCVYEINFFYEP